jgi:hypothetical protein
MEPVHPDSSPQLDTSVRIFLYLFYNLIGTTLPVVGDLSVDSETSLVTSSISRISRLSLSGMIIKVGLRACNIRKFISCMRG